MNKKIDKKTVKKGLLPYLFLFIIMLGVLYVLNVMNNDIHELSYDEFIEQLDKNKITEIELIARGGGYTYEARGTLKGYKENETFYARLPLSEEVMKKIVAASDEQEFKMTVKPDPDASSLLIILVNVVPILLFIGIVFWIFNKQLAGNRNSLDFGKSRAKLNTDDNQVTFKDVAGKVLAILFPLENFLLSVSSKK